MFNKTIVFFISLLIGLSSYSQDCENYFIYQQNDSLTFTFQGFMVDPGQTLFSWDFGDGNTANGKIVTHTFVPQGANIFEVCLYTETYDTLGNVCTDTSCQEITVGTFPACVAFFFGAPSPTFPQTWSFIEFSSGNPDFWSWDFGDGNTSTLQNPLHSYAMEGTYQVCLTITDSTGTCDDTYCEEIIVLANPTGGDCESDFTYSSNDLLTFDFEGYMLDTSLQAASYHWDFGDGTWGSGQFITHTYQPTGTTFYTACLTTTTFFTGGDSCVFESCHEVFVGNTPECQALYSWVFASQPLTIDFIDASVGGPTTWYWDFGDSTYSQEQHPSHTYSRQDIYTVCLTMTNDSTACTSTICDDVNVSNVAPPLDCSNFIQYTQDSLGHTFNFHGEALSNGANVSPISYFNWDMGDGNTASGQDVIYTYSSSGTYFVTLETISILNNSDTCIAFSQDTVMIPDFNFCIGGYIYLDSNTLADAGQAYLMTFDSLTNNLITIETNVIDDNGRYLFEDVNLGNGWIYYVQAELSQQSSYFGQYVPSYHYDAIYWTDALLAILGECPPVFYHDIMLQPGSTASPGNGSISGVVYNESTRDVVQGMEVLLLNEDMEPLTYMYTDENGIFDFSLLAYGIYYVHPEKVGIETSGFMVTLSEEAPSIEMNIIIGDGTASLSVEEYSILSIIDDLYPNPANTQINISILAEKAVNADVSVYNQLGQQMLIQRESLSKGLNKIELNIASLPGSVYYLRLDAKEGKPLMRRFIKVD